MDSLNHWFAPFLRWNIASAVGDYDTLVDADRSAEENAEIMSKISSLLFFPDQTSSSKFELFQRSRSSFPLFIIAEVCISLILAGFYWSWFVNNPSVYAGLMVTVVMLFPIIFGLFIIFIRVGEAFINPSYYRSVRYTMMPKLETIWLVSACMLYSFGLMVKVMNGKCPDTNYGFVSALSCDTEVQPHKLPEDYAVLTLLMPMIMSMILKGVRWEYVSSCWLFAVVNILFTIAAFNMYLSIVSFAICAPFTLLALYENQRQGMCIYLLDEKHRSLLAENERLADEIQANELRHMIGNVAHDLKTPLTGFMSGVELISSIIKEVYAFFNEYCEQNEQLAPDFEQVLESLDAIQISTDNIRSIHAFMLMTINRCIDYTKASRGLKLVPHLETINLKEVITLPMFCMQEMQSRIQIELEPFDEDAICPYIITDRQWLQENILCLLSNAVKYSSRGTVILRLFLDRDRPGLFDGHGGAGGVMWHSNFRQGFKRVDGEVVIDVSSGNGLCHSDSSSPGSLRKRVTAGRGGGGGGGQGEGGIGSGIISTHRSGVGGFDGGGSNGGIIYSPLPAETSQTAIPTNTSQPQSSSSQLQPGKPDEVSLVFEVIDTGIGLSAEAMENLFNPFKQAQRLAGGTGLGLFSLAKRVEALEGKFGVRHRDDGVQGSIFSFCIPFRPDTERARLLKSLKHQHHHHSSSGGYGHGSPGSIGGGGSGGGGGSRDPLVGKFPFQSRRSLSALLTGDSVGPSQGPGNMGPSSAGASGLGTGLGSILSSRLQRHPHSSFMRTSMGGTGGGDMRYGSGGGLSSPSGDSSTSVSTSGSTSPSTSLKLHVLLVDDSVPIQKMSSMILRRRGHTVQIAENGADALEYIQKAWQAGLGHTFDVILMDMHMPIMDGLECTRRLRELEAEAAAAVSSGGLVNGVAGMEPLHHVVIGVSANSGPEVVQAGVEAGLDAFIPKPFTIDAFTATYTETCEKIGHQRYSGAIPSVLNLLNSVASPTDTLATVATAPSTATVAVGDVGGSDALPLPTPQSELDTALDAAVASTGAGVGVTPLSGAGRNMSLRRMVNNHQQQQELQKSLEQLVLSGSGVQPSVSSTRVGGSIDLNDPVGTSGAAGGPTGTGTIVSYPSLSMSTSADGENSGTSWNAFDELIAPSLSPSLSPSHSRTDMLTQQEPPSPPLSEPPPSSSTSMASLLVDANGTGAGEGTPVGRAVSANVGTSLATHGAGDAVTSSCEPLMPSLSTAGTALKETGEAATVWATSATSAISSSASNTALSQQLSKSAPVATGIASHQPPYRQYKSEPVAPVSAAAAPASFPVVPFGITSTAASSVTSTPHSMHRSLQGSLSSPTSSSAMPPLKIIIVDDAIPIQKMLGMMLKRKGHSITVADDGAKGLEKVMDAWNSGKSFDVVLMDFQMPVMDGWESTRRIRSAEQAAAKQQGYDVPEVAGDVLAASLTGVGASCKYDTTGRGVEVLATTTSGGSITTCPTDGTTLLVRQSPQIIHRELQIQQQLMMPHLPASQHHIIIGISASSDHEVVADGYSSGIDAFIPKPFSYDVFCQTYEEVVHRGSSNSSNSNSKESSSKNTPQTNYGCI